MPRPAGDFLSAYPRIPSFPLARWAVDLIQTLRGRDRSDITLSSAMNQAALVVAHLGRADRAWQICDAELAWIARRTTGLAPSQAAPLLLLAIGPWVNQGRLLSSRGVSHEAQAHFAALYALNSGHDAELGPCHIDQRTWARIKEIAPHMEASTRSAYLIDSLKAYFQCGDFTGALDFIETTGAAREPGLRPIADEGRLIAASRLGLHDRALAITEGSSNEDPYHAAVLALYKLENRLALNEPDPFDSARRLAVLVAHDLFGSVPATSILRFIDKHGHLLEQIDEQRLALAVYVKGLELARDLDDQPFEWRFLRALLHLDAPSKDQRSTWEEALRHLLADCAYRVVRKAEGLSPFTWSLYDDLFGVVQEITSGPPRPGVTPATTTGPPAMGLAPGR